MTKFFIICKKRRSLLISVEDTKDLLVTNETYSISLAKAFATPKEAKQYIIERNIQDKYKVIELPIEVIELPIEVIELHIKAIELPIEVIELPI